MKKSINDYLTDLKKALTPKMILFIAAGVVAFVIHPLLGLIFLGVAVNFLLSFYTSKGVLERNPDEKEGVIEKETEAQETEDNPWNL